MARTVDKEAVRKRILDATMQVYSEIGLHASTIGEVAEASGLAKGTIYLYFESKEALTIALSDRVFRNMELAFMGVSTFTTLAAFAAHLKMTMTTTEERAKYVRVFSEVFGPSFAGPEFVKNVATFFDRLGRYYSTELNMLKSLGEVRSDLDTENAGRALAAMIDGVILHYGLLTIPVSQHEKMINASLDLLITGMKPNAN